MACAEGDEDIVALRNCVVMLVMIASGTGCPGVPRNDGDFCGHLGIICLPVGEFSAGITPPRVLLRYRDRPGLPKYCHRDGILDEIEQISKALGCVAYSSDLAGTQTSYVICADPDTTSACKWRYVAQFWQDRRRGSTEDYDLDMFAWVHGVCGSGEFLTFASPELTAALATQNVELDGKLRACR